MTTKEHMEAKIQQLIAKCDRLTRERDEARRMVCYFESRLDREYGNIDPLRFSPNALAAERGWDCFKEESK